MSYSFSYITLGMTLAYFFVAYKLITRIKMIDSELYTEFGEGRVWYSAPDQYRFFGFLFKFRYLKHHDQKIKILAFSTKVLLIGALYCIFTMPIFFSAST